MNRVGICEDMFLINAKHIENLQGIKFNYMKNLFEPTDEIMKNDINWFNKHIDIKEVHPLEEIFNKIKKLDDEEKRTEK